MSHHGVMYGYAESVVNKGYNIRPHTACAGRINTEDGYKNIDVSALHFEWNLELIRMLEFSDQPSRFQCMFAFPELEDAKEFLAENNYKGQIVEIEAEQSSRKDQNLIETCTFSQIFSKGRKYWRGEGSENPDWEILLELPVEVNKVVELE